MYTMCYFRLSYMYKYIENRIKGYLDRNASLLAWYAFKPFNEESLTVIPLYIYINRCNWWQGNCSFSTYSHGGSLLLFLSVVK